MAERIQFVDYLNTKIQIIPREWSKNIHKYKLLFQYHLGITCTFSLKNYLSHITVNFIVITSLSRCDYKTVLTCILLYLTVDRFRQIDGMFNFTTSRPSYTLALDTSRQPPVAREKHKFFSCLASACWRFLVLVAKKLTKTLI